MSHRVSNLWTARHLRALVVCYVKSIQLSMRMTTVTPALNCRSRDDPVLACCQLFVRAATHRTACSVRRGACGCRFFGQINATTRILAERRGRGGDTNGSLARPDARPARGAEYRPSLPRYCGSPRNGRSCSAKHLHRRRFGASSRLECYVETRARVAVGRRNR